MATQILYPIADFIIGIGAQYPSDGGAHYAKLLSADDDATRVQNPGTAGWQYDVYRIPRFALGTINSVSVVSRSKYGQYLSQCRAGFYSCLSGGYAFGASRGNASWTTDTDTWYTNPFTGTAWTIDNLAALELAVGLYCDGGPSYLTQLYVVIDYTPYGAASEVLYPNNAGSYTQITSQTPASGSHYDKTDDPVDSPDDNSTEVHTTSTTYQTDTYAMSDLSSGSVLRINAVVMLFRARGTATMGNGAYGKPALLTNSTLSYGTERSDLPVDGNYSTFAQVWTVNPVTGVAWTKAEVQALQAGIALKARSGGWNIYCTQVCLVVSYTVDQAPATPSTPSGNSSGLPATSYSYSTSTTDPETDSIQYTFDWGDGQQSSSGWVASGQSASLSHSWSAGTYSAKVKATDALGAVSAWSSIKTVTINTTPNAPSTPSGNSSGLPATSYSYSTAAVDPDGQNVYYIFDWGDGQTTQTGWYSSGATASASHSWASAGVYSVKVKAIDSMGAVSAWSSIKTVTINTPPNAPSTPSGSAVGSPTLSYEYTFAATDPDGQNVYYIVDWGDGQQTQTDPYASGATVAASHVWNTPGVYSVRVYAVDTYGAVSAWSGTLTVIIRAAGGFARVVGLC